MNFFIPILLFSIVSLSLLNFLRERGNWKEFKKGISKREVLKWAVYGALIPLWVEIGVIVSFINIILSSAFSIALAVVFSCLYDISRKRGISFFPFPILGTLLMTLAFSFFFVPPPPENWTARFNVGVRMRDLLFFYIWTTPPWVLGFAYARINLSKGVVALPILVSVYAVASFLLMPIFSKIGFTYSILTIIIFTAVILAVIVRRVGR